MINEYECPLCKSVNIQKTTKVLRNNYILAKCTECDFQFSSPRPTFDELSKFYNSIASVRFFKHSTHQAYHDSKYLAQEIKKYHSDAKRVLEIGASTGYYLFGLKQRGFEVIGSELSLDACKLAKEWYNIEMYDSVFPPISKFQNYFDVIIVHHVIEHVVNPL